MIYKNYIFDLDNTLYNEKDYLFIAYKKISEKIVEKNPHLQSEDLSCFLQKKFVSQGRVNLFNKLLENFSIKNLSVKNCLEILRTFKCQSKIKLFPDAYVTVKDILSKNNRIFVVTNGNIAQQKNKIKNIDWNGMKEDIVFVLANKYQPKPSVDSYSFIKKKYWISRSTTIMIGDMNSDMDFAKNIGIKFMFVNNFYEKYN